MYNLKKFLNINEAKLLFNIRKVEVNIKLYSNALDTSYKNAETKSKKESCKSISEKAKQEELQKNVSVAIVGGGCSVICMATLLKQNPAIKEIRIIDMDDSLIGPVCDIKQIDTSTMIKHYRKTFLMDGLRHCDIIALMDRHDFTIGQKDPFSQFLLNCSYVKNAAECMLTASPNAIIVTFAHPVTATLPLISEIYKRSGSWNPNKIIGSAALQSMRVSAITAISHFNLNPSFVSVPIAGGVDPLTVVPLFLRAKPFNEFSIEDEYLLIHQLRSIDEQLSKNETKGPVLSSGQAAAKFISTLVNGKLEKSFSMANAFVRSDVFPSCEYMTSEIQFGPNGIQQNFGLPKILSKELSLLEQATPLINKIVDSVIHYVNTGKI